MKFLPAIFTFFLAMVSVGAADRPLSVAVLDFQTGTGTLSGKGSEAALLVNAGLSSASNLMLVERQELEKILGEQELALGGMVSPDTAAKIGALTGAKVLVTGRLFEAGSKYFMVAKVMSTETSRVYGETATFGDPAGLADAAAELATKVAGVLEKNGETMVAQVEEPGAQVERLKKLVEGKKLPSVSVAVAEQHLRRPVIDPAVDTELQKALQEIGFEIIDPKSDRKPDVKITGEAFSEFGARRGNLVSCRGRVEIKVTETAGDKVLLVDRQTEAGVDIAENVAGKTALQTAARKLLDRIVPKLVN
jgi:hypothetical protein